MATNDETTTQQMQQAEHLLLFSEGRANWWAKKYAVVGDGGRPSHIPVTTFPTRYYFLLPRSHRTMRHNRLQANWSSSN